MEELDRETRIDPTEGDATYRELTASTVEAKPLDHDELEALMQVVAPGRPSGGRKTGPAG